MSIFNYILPSGAAFTVRGPADATQAQADLIFYEQVAAGALVGYTAGQTLTSTASKITKFELSRLDRGTAGVDTLAILAVIQNLPIVADIPSLVSVPIDNPVDQTDLILAKGDGLGPDAIGPLTAFQVQALQAQIVNLVDQDYFSITQDKGIGQYGFNSYQLEKAGYIKPGTSARLIDASPDDFVAVMSSPAVWTGLNGVDTLHTLLNDPGSQTVIQSELMGIAYDALRATGIITNIPEPSVSFDQGTVYTEIGLQTVNAFTLLGGSTALNNPIALNSSQVPNLSTISSGAVNRFNDLQSLAQNINPTALVNKLTSSINGDIGALITNASKWGTQATSLWATAGGLGSATGLANLVNSNLNNLIPSNLNNISIGGVSLSTVNAGIANLSNLTNLIPPDIGNLKSSLDIFGKASQFSLNFSNPLPNLSGLPGQLTGALTGQLAGLQGQLTGALGGLQGQLTGQLAGLQGALTGQLAGLQGALTGQLAGLQGALGGLGLGSLANFGGLANLGSLGSLFGGGGDLVSGTQVAAAFTNTVNRKTVDAAVTRILGNAKIQSPSFEYPSLASIREKLDISQAQGILSRLKSGGAQASTGISTFAQNLLG